MAVDLRLTYVGGGRLQARGKLDLELLEREFEAGEVLRVKAGKMRSVKQNDFFHALIQAAFANQNGGPSMANWEQLKAWLLIEAGHCDEHRIDVRGMSAAQAGIVAGGMAKVLRTKIETCQVTYDRGTHEVIMRFAKSVSFRAADRETMGEIVDRVVAIICTTIMPGSDPATILNQAKAKTT